MKMTSQPILRRPALIPELLLALVCAFVCPTHIQAANTHAAMLVRSSSQYFSAPDSPSLSVTGDLTVEAWVKFSSLPNNADYCIAGKNGGQSGAEVNSYAFEIHDSGGVRSLSLEISSNGANNEALRKNYSFVPGVWYHVAVAWNASTATAEFFVNGTSIGTATGSFTSIFNNNREFDIGRIQYNFSVIDTGSAYFDGNIDDVRLWGATRIGQQIQDNMFSELIGTEANLRGYWKLNNSLVDGSGNANNLVSSNSPVFQDGKVPFYSSSQQLEYCADSTTRALFHLGDSSDASPNGFNLSNSNGVQFSPAKFGIGADLGTGNTTKYLSTPSTLGTDGGGVTMSAFVKLNAEIANGTYSFLFQSSGGGGATRTRYQIAYEYNGGNRRLRFSRNTPGNGGADVMLYYPITLGTAAFYHLAVTYDGTTIRGYVNGIERVTGLASGNGTILTFSPGFAIGAFYDPAGANFSSHASALFDEVMVSGRVFSTEEILKYYGGIVTARFAALPGDGAVLSIGGTSWTTMRNSAAGNFVYVTDNLTQGGIAGNRGDSAADFVERGFFPFDTAALPDSGVQLSRAALSVYVPNVSPICPFFVTPQTQASVNTLTATDFAAVILNNSPQLSALQSTVVLNSANRFELNSTGLAYISAAGFTKLGTRSTYDVNNNGENFPEENTAATFSESSTNKPYLLVEYHALPGALFSISGTISGAGLPEGIIQVRAGSTSMVGLIAPGAYAIAPLLGGETYNVTAFIDANANQIRDPLEWGGDYSSNPLLLDGDKTNINITIVAPLDSDNDGLPDAWEVVNGLVVGLNDAALDLDGDGLLNAHELSFGTKANDSDSDDDGASDGDEVKLWGSNPLISDSDSDGIPDGWEIQHGLNPRFNDAADDLDGDGISNLAEYNWNNTHTNQLDPRKKYSAGTTLSDFAAVTGLGTNQFFYDRNNRLIGAEFDRGLALAYIYDGNDNLVRQVSMRHDANTNGLPDVWEFLNGLTNNANAYVDSDGDGWSDWQEWKSGTQPTNAASTPNLLGNPGTNIASLVLPFTPSNFVEGVGQLDGSGAEEIVLGADGNPGTNINFLLVLSQGATTWSTQRVDVGQFGITSIAVGQLTNRPSAGIYVGLRGTTNGSGRVMEYTRNGNLWQSNVVALATNQAAFVLGVRGQDVLVSLATTNAPDGSLSSVSFGTNWTLSLIDTNTSHRGLGIVDTSTVHRVSVRLQDAGGIEIISAGQMLVANSVYWAVSGSAYFLTATQSDWITAQSSAQQSGGNLVTIEDSAENNWITANFGVRAWIGLHRNTVNDPYFWISGSSATFRNWLPGQPENFEFYAAIEPTGQWGDWQVPGASFFGIVEVPAKKFSLPEPVATRTNNWRGGSLASGFLRNTNGSAIFYTFADDKNANGSIDFADDFVTAEYLVSGTNASLLTLSRQTIAALTPSQSYGLASVNFLNASNEVFFTGEPDGQVLAWTATGTTNPLQRQLFSGHHAGKAWHALASVKTFEPGEGLIGLRVDPTNQSRCDVILWSPQSALPQTAGIAQTAPAAAVLPATNTLGSLALVTVRLWDAEGNTATPFLQYQFSGSTNWQSATLVTLDGGVYSASTRVTASPSGVNHTVVWNAQADVGANVITNILLRARASDMTLLGEWSFGTPFNLNTALADNDGMDDSWELLYFGTTSRSGTGDYDGDGFTDYQEYIADTNPTNAASYLRITAITPLPTSVKLDWLGGSNATQFVQRTLSLSGGNTWSNLITNLPPTPITGSYTDAIGTNVMKFYRIEVTR